MSVTSGRAAVALAAASVGVIAAVLVVRRRRRHLLARTAATGSEQPSAQPHTVDHAHIEQHADSFVSPIPAATSKGRAHEPRHAEFNDVRAERYHHLPVVPFKVRDLQSVPEQPTRTSPSSVINLDDAAAHLPGEERAEQQDAARVAEEIMDDGCSSGEDRVYEGIPPPRRMTLCANPQMRRVSLSAVGEASAAVLPDALAALPPAIGAACESSPPKPDIKGWQPKHPRHMTTVQLRKALRDVGCQEERLAGLSREEVLSVLMVVRPEWMAARGHR